MASSSSSSLVDFCKKQQSSSSSAALKIVNIHKNCKLEEGEGEGEEEIHENDDNINNNIVPIATHLYLKPHSDGAPLDREVVLRRIRHRKRVRNVKNAVQALLTSPFKSPVSAPRVKWVDDAFAAL